MRRLLLAAAVLLPSHTLAQTGAFDHTAWLVGCWERVTATRRMVERWEPASGGVMLGTSHLLTDSTTQELEQLRLRYSRDTLIYDAHPGTQRRAQFGARVVTDSLLVFENPDHDLPQRISYRRVGADSLIAVTEGDRLGRRQPVTFRFRRASCGSTAASPTLQLRVELERVYEQMASREVQTFGARYEWFADHAGPDYRYVAWSMPGSTVTARDAAALRQTAQNLRASVSPMKPHDMRFTTTVERILVVADTAQVLVSAWHRWRFVDEAGRFGPGGAAHERGGDQRWIDTWVKRGTSWRLRATALTDDEVVMDGKVIVRNGQAATPTSP